MIHVSSVSEMLQLSCVFMNPFVIPLIVHLMEHVTLAHVTAMTTGLVPSVMCSNVKPTAMVWERVLKVSQD